MPCRLSHSTFPPHPPLWSLACYCNSLTVCADCWQVAGHHIQQLECMYMWWSRAAHHGHGGHARFQKNWARGLLSFQQITQHLLLALNRKMAELVECVFQVLRWQWSCNWALTVCRCRVFYTPQGQIAHNAAHQPFTWQQLFGSLACFPQYSVTFWNTLFILLKVMHYELKLVCWKRTVLHMLVAKAT